MKNYRFATKLTLLQNFADNCVQFVIPAEAGIH